MGIIFYKLVNNSQSHPTVYLQTFGKRVVLLNQLYIKLLERTTYSKLVVFKKDTQGYFASVKSDGVGSAETTPELKSGCIFNRNSLF